MQIDSGLVTMVSEELADYADDLETFWDTLDGETDVLDFVGTVLEKVNETECQIEAMNALIDRYNLRRNGLKQRKDALKETLHKILLMTNQKKIPHAIATVSLRKGGEILNITDENKIPSQLCKVNIIPDKIEIKKQLQAGVQIDGAELVSGNTTISIRMK